MCDQIDLKLENKLGTSQKLISFVNDRPGHDFRYAIDASKLKKDLDWTPKYSFKEGLNETIDWYINNQKWVNDVTNQKSPIS